jgi:hypothetical protein
LFDPLLQVADTHYRNQFETKTSCGTLSSSARSQWEDGLFNKIYAKATGYERVKVSGSMHRAELPCLRMLRWALTVPLYSRAALLCVHD